MEPAIEPTPEKTKQRKSKHTKEELKKMQHDRFKAYYYANKEKEKLRQQKIKECSKLYVKLVDLAFQKKIPDNMIQTLINENIFDERYANHIIAQFKEPQNQNKEL